MINSGKRRFTLISADGGELGEVMALVSHRSVEEAADGDLVRANESAVAIIEARYRPDGGFMRGMKLIGDGEYTVRMAKRHGNLWCVYVSRFHFKGEE